MKTSSLQVAGKAAVLIFLATAVLTACQFPPSAHASGALAPVNTKLADTASAIRPGIAASTKPSPANLVMARKQVPILCYHQIRDWRNTDSKQAKDYIVPVSVFQQQLKMLADSGYHTISADQLYNYLNNGTALPEKPILLSFDDTDLPQYTVAKPVMEQYGFKGLFFIMTVSLGRPHYMSRDQVRDLAQAGNEIGSHTWDHKNIKKFTAEDWAVQVDKPTKTLEAITGKPIKYFAYPFGLWDDAAIPHLKEHGFQAAFQLSAKRKDEEPLYTIRRIIVPGAWSAATLAAYIKHSF